MTDVRLIAHTVFNTDAVADLIQWDDEHIDGRNDADQLAEFAGRLCYLSFHRPNVNTTRNVDYIANIVRQRHFSVLEHSSATFLLLDVSRTMTHELVRHRHLSFSQVSQRYVDESLSHVVVPPVLRDATGPQAELLERNIMGLDNVAHELYSRIYQWVRDQGGTRKQARGAARAVLPGNTRTSIVVSGNMRAWREFLDKRLSPAADDEIREVAELVYEELERLAPASLTELGTGSL